MNQRGEKLFLLDGMALIYRAFFAFSQNPRITSTGLNASAMFGFTNTLLDILNNQKPKYMAVVFDTEAPTDRHLEFEAYKAHREEMPEDLKKSIPYIKRIIEGFNIKLLAIDGYEADDVIGTLALQAARENIEVFMMTPDKDFAQLVGPNIFIYKPARLGNEVEIMGVPEVLKKWEITDVKQVIDILGLWGDAVDNIPGVPGVGEKTAKKLIAEFGSIENILSNTDNLQGKMKEKFEQFREQALLSKKLATINISVPINFKHEEYLVKTLLEEPLKKVFDELEFKTLTKRVFNSANNQTKDVSAQGSLFDFNDIPQKPGEYNNIHSIEHHYHLIETEAEITSLVENFLNGKEFCFDTETTGLDATSVEIVGLSLSNKAHEAYYIPFDLHFEKSKNKLALFKPLFASKLLKIGQNIKYDLLILENYGIQIKGPLFDTMLAHYLIEPDQRHGMDILAESYLGYSPIAIEELIGKKGKGQLSMAMIDKEKIKDYAAEDADITYQLKTKLSPEIENRRLEKIFYDIELPLIPVLASMEREGVKVDKQFLDKYSKELNLECTEIENEIYSLAGEKFNISSPKQVGNILFEKLQLLDKPKTTKTGQYQTDEDTLQSLSEIHPIVSKILDYRQIQKLLGTYVDAIPKLINPKTGRVHTTFSQTTAGTGRLASQNPNLQNIPVRTEKGREMRRAFVPRDSDHVLISADYSQIELRIVASISKDKGMTEAFRHGIDIHTATAAKVYHVPIDEVTKEMRYKAKSVNFGIIYGQGAFGLASNLHISRSEAKNIIDNYFEQFPGIRNYMDSTINFAREHGYVETIKGRRRYIRDINSKNATVRGFAERNAINAPIQGSAADMIKIAMINIHQWLHSSHLKTRMILQVHDELLFDVPKSEIDEVRVKIEELMANAIELEVPVIVESGFGENWLVAH